MDPSVSILIPTHNRCDILAQTLESLNGLVVPADLKVEVIVIANACTDRTLETATAWISRLKIPMRVVEESVPGLSQARNRACREARFDVFAFLDDDVLVDPGWLTGLLETFEQTGASMLGGRVELWWEAVARPEWMIPDLEVHLSRLDLGETAMHLTEPNVVGANFAFTRKVFEDAGPFRVDLGRKGKSAISGEETDFIMKAFAAGHQLWYAPRASLRHYVPPHRAELSHLLGIMAGKSASLVLMNPRYGATAAARSIVGGLSKVVIHTAGLIGARASGNARKALTHRMARAVGIGQLQGCYLRLRGGN